MKIGILTFHHSRNYGAVLQAYGLKKVLEGIGRQVEVIDYRTPAIEKRKTPFAFKKFMANPIRYILVFFNVCWFYFKQVKNFAFFETNYLDVTKRQFTPVDIQQSDYDILVIGSDQVWNPILTDGPDPVYWGAYKPKAGTLITYAASSCATDMMEAEAFREVKEWLERFDAISVREERLKTYVESHSCMQAHVVLDPTLLAGREIFDRITPPRLIRAPYIFIYSVEGAQRFNEIAKRIAALYHAKIIVRSGSNGLTRMFKDKKSGISYNNASVEEMLSLVKYAECVVALSFHGAALSLLFEKDFYSIKGKNMARVEEILSKCHLMDRIVETPEEITLSHINYDVVNPLLDALRKDSYSWLKKALNQ